ncbi:MAG: 2-amino-4-hydroxy-6-hydroxymethyldihydropteridine diphosphokinase [Pseudomonadota bacterium]
MTDPALVRVWLGLGSNIDRQRHISLALVDLRAVFGDLVVSPIYESEAVGCAGDNFYNLVVGIETALSIPILARRLRAIEEKNGRQRNTDKFAPRTLDIDLLTYAGQVVDTPELQLPRDEITRYAFVLLPLSEVAAGEIHPLSGLTYAELWEKFDDPSQELWRVDQACTPST